MKDGYNLKVGDSAILYPHNKCPKRVKIIGYTHEGRSAIVHGISGSPENCQVVPTTQLVPSDWTSNCYGSPWYPQHKLISLTYAC